MDGLCHIPQQITYILQKKHRSEITLIRGIQVTLKRVTFLTLSTDQILKLRLIKIIYQNLWLRIQLETASDKVT